MAEVALISARRTRLEEKARQRSNGAKIALTLLNKPERFLLTVQIGITLIGLLIGAYSGGQLSNSLIPLFEGIPALAIYAAELSYALVFAFITFLSIVVGELVPKAIGITYAEQVTIFLSPFMRLLSVIVKPMVFLLSTTTRSILRLFRIKESHITPVTEEELKLMIEQGAQQGVIHEKETEMIKSIFRFGDRKAYAIMTPRQEMTWIDLNDPMSKIREVILTSNYSKFPVCNELLENIKGVVAVKDFLKADRDDTLGLQQVTTPVVHIPESLTALKILDLFREKRIYFGIVIDEYGATMGMITMHDLVENIFGELPGVNEEEDFTVVHREDGSMYVDGSMQIDELRDILDIPSFDADDDENDYATLGGFVMFRLNRVPHTGDHFTVDGYKFEVVDMDGHRVDKVFIAPEKPADASTEPTS